MHIRLEGGGSLFAGCHYDLRLVAGIRAKLRVFCLSQATGSAKNVENFDRKLSGGHDWLSVRNDWWRRDRTLVWFAAILHLICVLICSLRQLPSSLPSMLGHSGPCSYWGNASRAIAIKIIKLCSSYDRKGMGKCQMLREQDRALWWYWFLTEAS